MNPAAPGMAEGQVTPSSPGRKTAAARRSAMAHRQQQAVLENQACRSEGVLGRSRRPAASGRFKPAAEPPVLRRADPSSAPGLPVAPGQGEEARSAADPVRRGGFATYSWRNVSKSSAMAGALAQGRARPVHETPSPRAPLNGRWPGPALSRSWGAIARRKADSGAASRSWGRREHKPEADRFKRESGVSDRVMQARPPQRTSSRPVDSPQRAALRQNAAGVYGNAAMSRPFSSAEDGFAFPSVTSNAWTTEFGNRPRAVHLAVRQRTLRANIPGASGGRSGTQAR